MKIPRLRTRNGRFLRKLVPTPDHECCWLIWSRRYHCWISGRDGSLTSELAEAGLFTFGTAKAYHDGIDNEAFHVSEKVDLIDLQIGDMRRMLGLLEFKRDAAQAVAA